MSGSSEFSIYFYIQDNTEIAFRWLASEVSREPQTRDHTHSNTQKQTSINNLLGMFEITEQRGKNLKLPFLVDHLCHKHNHEIGIEKLQFYYILIVKSTYANWF